MLCHHGIKFEEATEPVENRIAYIKSNKPKDEVKTRLKWLRVIEESELDKGFWERWDEYRKQCDALWAEYIKQCDALWAEYDKQLDALWAEYRKQRNVLLWKLCPELKTIWDKEIANGLPWDEEKHSLIFSKGTGMKKKILDAFIDLTDYKLLGWFGVFMFVSLLLALIIMVILVVQRVRL